MEDGAGTLYIGTSGIVVPGAKATFPVEFQDKSRLTYYSTLFNSLEVNSSFYKIPLPQTFEKWAQEVGEGFRFTVKLWREITHAKELAYNVQDMSRFMQAADRLGSKKGTLLIQFPPSLTSRFFKKVEALLRAVQEADASGGWIVAVEFRHASWYAGEDTRALLDEHGATLVLHDKRGFKVTRPNDDAPALYLRYHGPAGDYKAGYEADFLSAQAERVQDWLADGRDVYAYFNNTMGAAFDNARLLGEMVAGAGRL